MTTAIRREAGTWVMEAGAGVMEYARTPRMPIMTDYDISVICREAHHWHGEM
jgi:hypothetical protein